MRKGALRQQPSRSAIGLEHWNYPQPTSIGRLAFGESTPAPLFQRTGAGNFLYDHDAQFHPNGHQCEHGISSICTSSLSWQTVSSPMLLAKHDAMDASKSLIAANAGASR